ncbi:PilZ domain-containing protein [Lachnospiraceae bacterium ZAX-1]
MDGRERRREKRLDLDVSLQIERLNDGGDISVKFVHVQLTDLSKTGIGFITEQELEKGTYYDAKIQLWTKEVIDTVIEVVRCKRDEDGNYIYGCIFIGLMERDALKVQIYQMFNEAGV